MSSKLKLQQGVYLRKVYWISLLVGTILALIYTFESCYMGFMGFLSHIFSSSIAGASAATSIFALKKYWEGLDSRLTRVWLYFALGLILLFLGELTRGIYALALNVAIPYPSIADAFWLVSYIPFLSALISYLSLVQPAISKRIREVSYATVLVNATVFSYLFIIPAAFSEGNTLTRIINIAYPSLDLILLAFSIEGLLVFTTTRLKGKIDKVWILLNAGILMKVIADSLFSYATAKNTYYNGHPLELFFQFGYLSFLTAFYIHTKEL